MTTIRSHWYRGNVIGDPCLLNGCGRPQAEHVESCGEWADPVHWYRPSREHPLTVCGRCQRHPAHSTHRGSRKGRSLRRPIGRWTSRLWSWPR